MVFSSKSIFTPPDLADRISSQESILSFLVGRELRAGRADRPVKVQPEPVAPVRSKAEQERRDKINAERTQARAYNKVFDIVYQNDWSYFVTLTFDQTRFDSKEAQAVIRQLRAYLSNQVQRRGLAYLLTAERHKKGGIHCHLLTNDRIVVEDSGTRIVRGFDKPLKLSTIRKLKIPDDTFGKIVYNLPEWKFGFSTAIPVDGEPSALANYMTKYITKDCCKIFGKYYWSSKNLKRDTEIDYVNVEYSSILAREYYVPGHIKLKYRSDWEEIK